ncbi:MAG: DUF1963 domain-containing protein [Isosphaeraceae bacterium]
MNPDVRAYIEKHLSPAVSGRVASLMRPCILAGSERCAEGDIDIGGSKFGGRPDVPDGFVWPMAGPNPCWFVAQVRLADLQPFDAGYRLPADGLLSFFYHDDRGPAGSESRILVLPSVGLRRVEVVPDLRYGGPAFHERHFPCRSIQFAQGYTLQEGAGAAGDEFAEEFNELFGRWRSRP